MLMREASSVEHSPGAMGVMGASGGAAGALSAVVKHAYAAPTSKQVAELMRHYM